MSHLNHLLILTLDALIYTEVKLSNQFHISELNSSYTFLIYDNENI
jgi:hypothetical protein